MASSAAALLRSVEGARDAVTRDLLTPVPGSEGPRPDLLRSRWDEATYLGRYRHFWDLCVCPKNMIASDNELEEAKLVVQAYLSEPGTVTASEKTAEELWAAKLLVDSAFHPETGAKIPWAARMSSQLPVNTLVCGCMLYFRHTVGQLMFWQWINQSVNFVVNYGNRSQDGSAGGGGASEMLQAYGLATGSSWAIAVAMNRLVMPGRLLHRLIPFFAGAGPQSCNVAFSRKRELAEGVPMYTDEKLEARVGAGGPEDVPSFVTPVVHGGLLVWLTRVAMAAPSLAGTAMIMGKLVEPRLKGGPTSRLTLPLTAGVYCLTLALSTPFGLALWPSTQALRVEQLSAGERARLPPEVRDQPQKLLWYSKGL